MGGIPKDETEAKNLGEAISKASIKWLVETLDEDFQRR